jgi:hypothetical protein
MAPHYTEKGCEGVSLVEYTVHSRVHNLEACHDPEQRETINLFLRACHDLAAQWLLLCILLLYYCWARRRHFPLDGDEHAARFACVCCSIWIDLQWVSITLVLLSLGLYSCFKAPGIIDFKHLFETHKFEGHEVSLMLNLTPCHEGLRGMEAKLNTFITCSVHVVEL